VSSGSDTSFSLAGNGFQQYPNLVGNPVLAHRSIFQWFNTAAYAIPAAGTFVMSRETACSSRADECRLLPRQVILIWRESQIAIRADANNVFNHPSFGFTNPQTVNIDSGNSSINQTTVGAAPCSSAARLSF